jgi:hypothetical protein
MGQYDLFRKIAQSSLSTKERTVNQIKYDIASDFEGSPSYEDVLINNVSKSVHIVTDKKDNKIMLSKPDETFVVGDVITWNSNKFLVTDIDENQNIQTKGTIQLCNNTLKFYNKDNETSLLWVLNQVPCIVETPFKTNAGLDENRYMSLSVTDYQVILPDNVSTSIISSGTRFILNGRAFKCEGYDNLSSVGIKIIKISITEFNADDDKINSIADKLKYQNIYTLNLLSGSIVDLNYLNQTSKIEVECFANGVKDDSPTLTIANSSEYVCDVDNETLIITANGTGQSIITITYGNVSKTITVNGTLIEGDNFALSISGTDSLQIGQQSTFVSNVTNNGVTSMTRPIVWELVADDGVSSTTLASILSNSGTHNENAVVKANTSNQYGYVKLKARTDTNNCNNIKRIQIKSLL